jgi:anti-anti-sigma factor
MPLTFDSHVTGHEVAVIRCKGRITFGPEAEALEAEVDRQSKFPGTNTYVVTGVVLQLNEIDFIDSSGLGAIVRMFGVLRNAGCGLKLCQMSPKVYKVIELTHLESLFPAYTSEAEAIESFSIPSRSQNEQSETPKIRIVCVDPSKDLLAGLSASLTRSGYEVYTTRFMGEAATLTRATTARVLICGPGMAEVSTAADILDDLRQIGDFAILQLPSDFGTAEAGQASQELLSQLQALIAD